MLAAVEGALGLVDGGVAKGSPHAFQVEPFRGKLRRVDLNPDRRVLLATNPDETHAGHLRELLGEDAIGVIADLAERKRIRSKGDEQDWRVSRVGLPVDRRIEEIGWQFPG